MSKEKINEHLSISNLEVRLKPKDSLHTDNCILRLCIKPDGTGLKGDEIKNLIGIDRLSKTNWNLFDPHDLLEWLEEAHNLVERKLDDISE